MALDGSSSLDIVLAAAVVPLVAVMLLAENHLPAGDPFSRLKAAPLPGVPEVVAPAPGHTPVRLSFWRSIAAVHMSLHCIPRLLPRIPWTAADTPRATADTTLAFTDIPWASTECRGK